MGRLNLKKIKAKAAEIKQAEKDRKAGGGGIFLKIPVGTIELRVLPPWSDEGLLSKEIFTHFRLPPGGATCVDVEKSYPGLGLDSPISDVIDEFESCLDVWKLRSKATPKLNVYLPDCEMNRDCEDLDNSLLGKVLIASPSLGTYNDIIKKISNPRIGDITDPDAGYYITLEKTTGAKWQDTSYTVELIPDKCPIHEDEEEQEKILSQMHDLDKIFPPPSDDKLNDIQTAAGQLAKHLEKLARENGYNITSEWSSSSRKRKSRPAPVEEPEADYDDDEEEEEEAPPPKPKPRSRRKKKEADRPFQNEGDDEAPPATETKASTTAKKKRRKAVSGKPECFADSDIYNCDDAQSVACTKCMWEVPCFQKQKKAGTLVRG